MLNLTRPAALLCNWTDNLTKLLLLESFAHRCLGSLLSQLDGPWAGYVEGVERLTRVDADVALRQLEAKVQEAIMYSFENRIVLENKVSAPMIVLLIETDWCLGDHLFDQLSVA